MKTTQTKTSHDNLTGRTITVRGVAFTIGAELSRSRSRSNRGGHMLELAAVTPEDWGKLGEAVKAELRAQALYAAAVRSLAWRAA